MKKRILIALVVVLALAATASLVWADKPIGFDAQGNETAWANNNSACTKIQDGTLLRSDGVVITTGYDEWGYNYQAHMFNGMYCDAYRNAAWCQPYADDELMMKWNDAWLANVDCDGDDLLDRHYGSTDYEGSGAWLTNHQRGTYEYNGTICEWDWFVKIVAKPSVGYDCTSAGAVQIWGAFCEIQSVYNDPCGGFEGVELLANPAGLSNWP